VIGLSVHVYYPAMREYYETARDRLVAMGYDIPPIRRPSTAH